MGRKAAGQEWGTMHPWTAYLCKLHAQDCLGPAMFIAVLLHDGTLLELFHFVAWWVR